MRALIFLLLCTAYCYLLLTTRQHAPLATWQKQVVVERAESPCGACCSQPVEELVKNPLAIDSVADEKKASKPVEIEVLPKNPFDSPLPELDDSVQP